MLKIKGIGDVLLNSFVCSLFFDFVIKRILKARQHNAEYLIVDIPTYNRYDTNLYWKYNRHESGTSFIISSQRLLVLRLHKLSRINMIFTFKKVVAIVQEINIDFLLLKKIIHSSTKHVAEYTNHAKSWSVAK